MMKFASAYAATAIVMLALDALWLGVIAKPLYQQGIGHLMAERPNLAAAALFYAVYALGIVIFAVAPQAIDSWGRAAVTGALFGAIAYATYDLTNLATLKQWPLSLACIDIAWGSVVSAVSAAAGRLALEQMAS